MIDGVRLSCLQFGGAGPAALILHGLYGRALEWRTTAEWLMESHEVFALDQRGHGESAKHLSDVSRDSQVNDVVAVIQAMDRGPVLLIGQSMGGLTALLAAARHPDLVSRLIIIEATSYGGGGGESWLSRWPLPFANLDRARAFFRSQGVNEDVWVKVLQKSDDGYWPEFYAHDMEAAAADICNGYDYRDECSLIRCPVLVVGGGRSWMDQRPVQELASGIPGATYVCIQVAGHDVHLDAPDALRSVTERFLNLG